VANSVLLALSGSSQTTPTYWLDPSSGVQYLVNVRVPEPATTTCRGSNRCRSGASVPGTGNGQILSNLATVSRTTSQPIFSHYNVMPVVDVSRTLGPETGRSPHRHQTYHREAKKTAPKRC